MIERLREWWIRKLVELEIEWGHANDVCSRHWVRKYRQAVKIGTVQFAIYHRCPKCDDELEEIVETVKTHRNKAQESFDTWLADMRERFGK